MQALTRDLWAEQDQHEGDRLRLYRAVNGAVDATSVRTPRFFADDEGVREIVAAHGGSPTDPEIRFIHGDYTQELGLDPQAFDLLVSLYSGFVSEHCTDQLRIGGTLLVNPSHGDAAMASIDRRYRLAGAVHTSKGGYRVTQTGLDQYLIPKKPIEITSDLLHQTGRGVGYTKPAFAYLFERIR